MKMATTLRLILISITLFIMMAEDSSSVKMHKNSFKHGLLNIGAKARQV